MPKVSALSIDEIDRVATRCGPLLVAMLQTASDIEPRVEEIAAKAASVILDCPEVIYATIAIADGTPIAEVRQGGIFMPTIRFAAIYHATVAKHGLETVTQTVIEAIAPYHIPITGPLNS